jgi:hypothetical protein
MIESRPDFRDDIVAPGALPAEVGTGSAIRKRSKCLILEQIISDQVIPPDPSLL